jgi:hypothetical protein
MSYTHSVFEGHQTDGVVKEKIRYEFSVTAERRQQMLSLIAQELMDEIPDRTPLQALASTEDTSAEAMGSSSQSMQDGSKSQGTSESTTDGATDDDADLANSESPVGSELSEQKRERVADIIRLAPTSNGDLASEWGFETGKEAWQYLSQHLDDYYRRNENSRIEPTEEAIQIVG